MRRNGTNEREQDATFTDEKHYSEAKQMIQHPGEGAKRGGGGETAWQDSRRPTLSCNLHVGIVSAIFICDVSQRAIWDVHSGYLCPSGWVIST